jgi:hypothetical protein
MMPKRIQRKRAKGWKMPEDAVYVGRPTKWGNPYQVKQDENLNFYVAWETGRSRKSHYLQKDAAKEAVELFRNYMRFGLDSPSCIHLRDKDLACWCPLDKPCHADVLLELANKLQAPPQADAGEQPANSSAAGRRRQR